MSHITICNDLLLCMLSTKFYFFFNDTATTEIYTLSLHDALPILSEVLTKYGIDSNGTDTIPLFSLQTHEIQGTNEHLEHFVGNILFRMKHYRSLIVDSWNLCV